MTWKICELVMEYEMKGKQKNERGGDYFFVRKFFTGSIEADLSDNFGF